MEMKGSRQITAPRAVVWAALNDAEVLKTAIPGCQSLSGSPGEGFTAVVKQKVGPVGATFEGQVRLTDIVAMESYTIVGEGKGGAAGFAKGAAQVNLSPQGNQTRLAYDVKANVGGKLAQIGSRLVDAAAKKVADEFFQNFTKRMTSDGDATVVLAEQSASAADDKAMPSVSRTTLMFFAAGVLVVFFVALIAFFG